MSQVIAIRFPEASDDLLEEFLKKWEVIDSYEQVGHECYDLSQGANEDSLTLILSSIDSELTIEGYTTDDSWEAINDFARVYGGAIYHEGESLESDEVFEGMAKPNLLGTIVSVGVLLGAIIAMPFILIYGGLRVLWCVVIRRR